MCESVGPRPLLFTSAGSSGSWAVRLVVLFALLFTTVSGKARLPPKLQLTGPSQWVGDGKSTTELQIQVEPPDTKLDLTSLVLATDAGSVGPVRVQAPGVSVVDYTHP